MLLGEFGTTFRTDSDRMWLQSLVGYLDRTGISFSYWSFNPNSGDTGGIVADDWRTPQQDKLDALRPILEPAAATASPMPTPTRSSPPPARPTPPTPPPTAPATNSGLDAQWVLQSSWGEGYVADVVLTATASVSTWSVSWESPGATAVANSWGMDCTVHGQRITCTGASWAASLAPGQSVRVGLQVSSSGEPTAPALTVRSS